MDLRHKRQESAHETGFAISSGGMLVSYFQPVELVPLLFMAAYADGFFPQRSEPAVIARTCSRLGQYYAGDSASGMASADIQPDIDGALQNTVCFAHLRRRTGVVRLSRLVAG